MQQTADNPICACPSAPQFSWSRVKAVINFFYPLLRGQIIIYPCVALALYVLAALGEYMGWNDILWAAPTSIMSFMYYLAPVVLTRRDSRMVVTMLPATALEKTVVLAGYFLVFVPILTFGVYYLFGSLVELFVPVATVIGKLRELRNDLGGGYMFLYQASEVVPVITCLWTVVYVKRNRTLKSVVYAFVAVCSLGVIGMVCGLIAAFSSGFVCGLKGMAASGRDIAPEDVDAFVKPLLTDMVPFFEAVGVLSIVYIAFGIYMVYHTLKKRQN